MKKRLPLLAAASLLASLVSASGQSLADVLSSLQERQRAVQQSRQVAAHIPSVDGGSVEVPSQVLIDWQEVSGVAVSDFPTEQALSNLGIDDQLSLLNSAITEFRRLRGQFVNLRPEDLSSGKKIGAIRPFLREDFPEIGRADASNYHSVLRRLAEDVSRLRVLPWPLAGKRHQRSYVISKWEERESDGNDGYNIVTKYADDTVEISGWAPSNLGSGSEQGSPYWAYALGGGLAEGDGWFTSLEESVSSQAYFDSYFYEDAENGNYNLRYLFATKDTFYHSEAALFAKVPGRSGDQIDGKVALLRFNEWTPTESGDVNAPSSWDNSDAGYVVMTVAENASGSVNLPDDSSISVNIDWVTIEPPMEGDEAKVAVAAGFDDLKAYTEGSLSPAEWELSWENVRDLEGGAGVSLRRQLHALCAPSFSRGLDAGDRLARLEDSASFARPPAGDGEPRLHPLPGILVGIPVGVGLEGSSSGWVGISPTDFSFYRGSPSTFVSSGIIYPDFVAFTSGVMRFDHASNLRFIGPAQDYHVVYATGRDASARGVGLPDWAPTSAEDTGSGWYQKFFTAWDMPRLRQVVSRDLIIDLTPQGHYQTQVKVYRRPASAGPVDRTPGVLAPTSPANLIRTLVFSNPDAGNISYPAVAEKVRVAGDSTIHEVWRDGLVSDPDWDQTTVRFRLVSGTAEHFSEVIEFPHEFGTRITTRLDGRQVAVDDHVDNNGWAHDWWDYRVPSSTTRTSGGQTIVFTHTHDASAAGTQGGFYPSGTTINYPDEPDVTLAWNASGRLQNSSRGAWATTWAIDGSDLKATTRLNGSLAGTTWTTWSNGGRTVRVTEAPDGSASSKGAAANDWSELEFGNAAGTGLPGLPHKLARKDGSGATWNWTTAGGGGTVEIADGLLSGGAVTSGSKSVVSLNARGYVASTSDYLIQGGGQLKVAGSSTPSGQSTAWGAPLKAVDYTSGLESSWSFDGQKERLGSATDTFGNVSAFSTYDALGRPTAFSWKGHAGGAAYNSSGFGVSSSINLPGRTLARTLSWDARGRPTGGSATAAGASSSFSLAYAATAKALSVSDTVTGASGTMILRSSDGSLEDAAGTTLAFGGLNGTTLSVDGGLIKSTTSLDGLAASFRTTWTDAWGRLRKVAVAGTDGSNSDATNFAYSDPGSTTKKAEVHHASGRRLVREIQPWAPGGIVTRSGIDKNQNGLLDAGDRFVTTTTGIVGSSVRTTVSQTGNATALMVRDYTPSTGVTTTTFNGGEEVITETPNFGAKTIAVTRKRGAVVVESSLVALNHLGQPDNVTASGTGIPPATVDPAFRTDGSLASLSLTVGGATSSLSFNQDGTLAGATHPILGALSVSHGFAAGEETLTIDGTTSERSLNGTSSSLTGAGVMDRSRSTAVSGGGFQVTISPATGSGTVLASNAAGAKTLHNYAAGADTQTDWLAGGLLESVSLGRGGNTSFGYSADGARDLESISWPSASSSGFATELFYGGSIGFGRDAAGNIDSITDPSGERSLDHEKNRLATTDWLSGELNAYKVVRAYDANGRLETVTLHRDGAPLHAIGFGHTGDSDEISGVTAGGFSASYGRDTANRLVTSVTRGTVVQDWGRGTAGRITSAGSNVSGAPDFDYTSFDSKGRRKTVATNKGTWTYTYRGGDGGDGQLVDASAAGLGSFSYTFDGIGRRTDFAGNSSDALNRFLTIDHGTGPKQLYISAASSARLWVNGVEMTPFNGGWVHDLANPGSAGGWVPWLVKAVIENGGEPGASSDAVAELGGHIWFPPQSESFTYDADGNRESSALWDYGWDGRNRLVRAATRDRLTAAEGWDLSFDYDAEGRRFKKEVTRYENGQPAERKTIYFVWDGWDLIYERHEDASGNLLMDRKYVWGLDLASSPGGAGGAGGLLLMRETRGQTTRDFYPLHDGSGHVVGMSDDAGNLVAEYWYGPFGELIEAGGEMADANPWRYATKYYDRETGLYYFGRRYYDPVTGQWLSREPLGEDESLNLYAYCHNDPVNKVDVLGLEAKQVDVRLENGIPAVIFEEWAGTGLGYVWNAFAGGNTKRWAEFPDAQTLAIHFEQRNGVWAMRDHQSRVRDFRAAQIGAVGDEIERVGWYLEAAPKIAVGLAAAPYAIAYGPALLTEGGILLHGYGSAALSSVGSTSFTVGGTAMLGSGTTYTLAQIGTAAGITAETGMLMWVLGTDEGRNYGGSVGASGLPPQAQAAMLGLNGPAAMWNAVGPSWGARYGAAEKLLPLKENPTLFLNNFPEHPTGPPLQLFTPGQLPGVTRRLNYVVLEDGGLVIGRRANELGGGHIDLAGGRPVLAAGEVKLIGGKITYVDNTSGHYVPFGPDAEESTRKAFRLIGYDDIPYSEKVWSESLRRWVPAP